MYTLTLHKWLREEADNSISKDMKYREAAFAQANFFDRLSCLFLHPDIEYGKRKDFCKICSWHTSKSINLPVYYFSVPGLEVYARNNFHNWNVSIRSAKKIELPQYFSIDGGEGYLFMEGMEQWRYPVYEKNKEEFSFCTWDNYSLYAIMWCIASQHEKMK